VKAALPPSPLTLTRLSPNIGLVGMNGDYKSLTIIGTGFISGAVVNFDSDVLTPSAVTSTAVEVTIPVAEFSLRDKPRYGRLGEPALLHHQPRVRVAHFRRRVLFRLQQGRAHPRCCRGLKCTFYTITTLVGDTVDGYVTQSQLQALYKNGHEIGNHTRTHPFLSTVSSTQLTSETSGAQQDLQTRKILRMVFFQLHHPPDVTVLCDRKGCEQVADYLEVDDYGHEYRVCTSHTDSKTHASRLPTRKPSPDLPFRSRPAA
jgi:hypothetical protein